MSITTSTVINLQTLVPQRELINRAARLQGKSRTDFMREGSRHKAQQVLLDQTLFTVTVTDIAAWCLRLGAAAIKRATSLRLSTTGPVPASTG